MERAWDSHEGLRGGDGEESGQQGPGGAGVLTSLRGRRPLPGARRAVRGSGSRRAGPASLGPSPTGPSPAPPDRSPREAPATPCASAGLQKLWAPYPTAALISGLARSALLGADRDRNRAGGQDKEAETRTEMGTGEEPERKERCEGLLCFPSLSRQKGGGRGSGPKPPGHSSSVQKEAGVKKSQMAPAFQAGELFSSPAI